MPHHHLFIISPRYPEPGGAAPPPVYHFTPVPRARWRWYRTTCLSFHPGTQSQVVPHHRLFIISPRYPEPGGTAPPAVYHFTPVNAHLGKNTCNTNAYYECTNRNGQHLLDFAQENAFTIGWLKFNKKSSKKVTWTAPNGQLHQNDHILIRSKWQNSLRNCESYIKPSVQSDHRIVTATRPKVIKYDWEKLKSDTPMSTTFQLKLHNRYRALMDLETSRMTSSKTTSTLIPT